MFDFNGDQAEKSGLSMRFPHICSQKTVMMFIIIFKKAQLMINLTELTSCGVLNPSPMFLNNRAGFFDFEPTPTLRFKLTPICFWKARSACNKKKLTLETLFYTLKRGYFSSVTIFCIFISEMLNISGFA